jgi:glycogen(starch) synthase
MRVVLTVNYSPWSAYCGGGQASVHAIGEALVRRGHDVSVVYTKPRLERVDVPAVAYRLLWADFFGLRSRSTAPLRTLNAISVARLVAREHRRKPVDVVHCHGEEGALIPGIPGRCFRVIVTPRYPSYPAGLTGGGLRRLAVHPKYHALGHLIRGADCCCPTSRASATLIAKAYGIGEQGMAVVPNGVRQAFLAVERRADERAGPLVFFGRLEPGKGIDTLVEALLLLGDRAPRTVIAGRGSAEPALRARVAAASLGERIAFLRWQSDKELADLLAGARLAVLPSREESFGNAVLEAMAAGVPLVSTTAGSIPEIVGKEASGMLVPAGHAPALAQAIGRTLEDSDGAEQRARRARRAVAERFTWEVTAARLEAVYGGAMPGASIMSAPPC